MVPTAGAERSEALISELQAHAKQMIAPYKYPREIEFVESLPQTASGKVERRSVVARFSHR